MATVKVKFRAPSTEFKEGVLYYRVIHNRMARQIHASKVYDCEWDDAAQDVVLQPGIAISRREYLLAIRKKLAEDIARLQSIISRLDRNGKSYTADKVVELFNSKVECGSFISFARHTVAELKRIGKERTSETYATALRSFLRFRKNRDILFDEMDSALMVEYESDLKKRGICPNSTSFYMRNLRAIYNRAVEENLTRQNYPFRHVYTGIDKTMKRAVPLKVIRQLRDLKLKENSGEELARDLFMFSFYTRGMSFIDMAYLKKSDLKNGILSYRRQKTGQQLFIKWEKPMQEIIARYDTSATPYLLPIIRDATADDRRQYLNASHCVNARLKKLGEKLRLSIPLTSYVARHAWASIAKSKNIPISIISEAMGHDSESTTRIYLASLDTSCVDKANYAILKSL